MQVGVQNREKMVIVVFRCPPYLHFLTNRNWKFIFFVKKMKVWLDYCVRHILFSIVDFFSSDSIRILAGLKKVMPEKISNDFMLWLKSKNLFSWLHKVWSISPKNFFILLSPYLIFFYPKNRKWFKIMPNMTNLLFKR